MNTQNNQHYANVQYANSVIVKFLPILKLINGKNLTITGTVALVLQGLPIHRAIGDIDIIINNITTRQQEILDICEFIQPDTRDIQYEHINIKLVKDEYVLNIFKKTDAVEPDEPVDEDSLAIESFVKLHFSNIVFNLASIDSILEAKALYSRSKDYNDLRAIEHYFRDYRTSIASRMSGRRSNRPTNPVDEFPLPASIFSRPTATNINLNLEHQADAYLANMREARQVIGQVTGVSSRQSTVVNTDLSEPQPEDVHSDRTTPRHSSIQELAEGTTAVQPQHIHRYWPLGTLRPADDSGSNTVDSSMVNSAEISLIDKYYKLIDIIQPEDDFHRYYIKLKIEKQTIILDRTNSRLTLNMFIEQIIHKYNNFCNNVSLRNIITAAYLADIIKPVSYLPGLINMYDVIYDIRCCSKYEGRYIATEAMISSVLGPITDPHWLPVVENIGPGPRLSQTSLDSIVEAQIRLRDMQNTTLDIQHSIYRDPNQ